MSSALLWKRLEVEIERMAGEFPGVAGVSVVELSGSHRLDFNADEEFPTASTIKIHILTQLMMRVHRGELDLDERVCVTPQMHVAGGGVLTLMERDIEISVLDLAILMIIVSDNTATNICIDYAGMDATNQLLDDMGLKNTRLKRKMVDDAAIARNEENVSTPSDCTAMMRLLYTGKPVPEVAKQVLNILKKPKNTPFAQVIPKGIVIADKGGTLGRVRCDTGIVYLSRRPYAISVMTKFALQGENQGAQFIADVVRAVHETMVTLDATTDFGRNAP